MGEPGTTWMQGEGWGTGFSTFPGDGSGVGTNDSWPIWAGKVDNPGDTLTFEIDGESYEVTPDANGAWDFTPPTALDNGSHEISVTARNAAGDETTLADGWSYDVDADSQARQNDYLRHRQWEEGGRQAAHDAYGPPGTPPRPMTGGGGGGGGEQSALTTPGGGTTGGGGGGGGGQPPSEKGNQPRT